MIKKNLDNEIRYFENEIKKTITLHNMGKISTKEARSEVDFLNRIINDLLDHHPMNKKLKYLINREFS